MSANSEKKVASMSSFQSPNKNATLKDSLSGLTNQQGHPVVQSGVRALRGMKSGATESISSARAARSAGDKTASKKIAKDAHSKRKLADQAGEELKKHLSSQTERDAVDAVVIGINIALLYAEALASVTIILAVFFVVHLLGFLIWMYQTKAELMKKYALHLLMMIQIPVLIGFFSILAVISLFIMVVSPDFWCNVITDQKTMCDIFSKALGVISKVVN